MSEKNKERYARVTEEVWNGGDLDAIDKYYAPDVVIHPAAPGLPSGTDRVRTTVSMLRSGLSNFRLGIDYLIAEDDMLAAHWTMKGTHTGELYGIPATGKAINSYGISVMRMSNGKIVEIWGASDQLGLMRELGAIPS